MAGMFYSLEETIEKLNKSEDQIKQLVKDGKLREFRDGANLLFKIEEVEALAGQAGPPEETPQQAEPTIPEAAPSMGEQAAPTEEPQPPIEEIPTAELEEIGLAEEQPGEGLDEIASPEEISLAPEEAAQKETPPPSKSAEADSSLAEHGVSILGETDSEYKLTDDTMGETQAAEEEAILEEIEGDVNLDSFGSGSGLLDLSLQADDTSLGGILDEIYTSEEEKEAVQEGSTLKLSAAETGRAIAEEELVGAEAGLEAGPVLIQAPIEATPDALSNALGIMLLFPFLAVVYTGIVAVAGFSDIMPSVLEKIQGLIWYVVGGLFVVALFTAGTTYMIGRGGPKKPKTPKEAKPKKEKKKKEKKPKEEKPEKPKKEKA